MKQEYQLYPDKKFYSLKELEKKLGFHFLSQNSFETGKEKQEIFAKGMERLKNNEIEEEHLQFGKKYLDKIKSTYISKVSIRLINEDVGYGLFAEENISKGSFVGEYIGTIRKNERRYCEPINNYCYKYPIPDHIDRDYVIDGTRGSLTRFINHSYHPNLKHTYAFIDGFYHLIFLSIHKIKRGSQLFCNYGKNYWYVRDAPFDL